MDKMSHLWTKIFNVFKCWNILRMKETNIHQNSKKTEDEKCVTLLFPDRTSLEGKRKCYFAIEIQIILHL